MLDWGCFDILSVICHICSYSFSYALKDGLIETEILSQRAVSPIAVRTAKTLWDFGRFECNGVKPKTNNLWHHNDIYCEITKFPLISGRQASSPHEVLIKLDRAKRYGIG